MNAFAHVWRQPWVRVAVWLLLGWAALRLLVPLGHVLLLAGLAYVVAYLMNPLLRWLQRRHLPRALGLLVVVLLLAVLIGVLSSLLVTVATQLVAIVQNLPDLARGALAWLITLVDRYPVLEPLAERARALSVGGAAQLERLITSTVLPYLERTNGALLGGVLGVASGVLDVLLVLILSMYLMLDFDKVGLTLLRLFPRPWQPRALEYSAHVGAAVGGYLRGQLLIALGVGVITWLGLALAGVPSALALGFLAGAFNIVPYLGVLIAIVPAVLLAAPLGVLKVALVLLVFIVANQVEGQLLSPMVLGHSTDLHPVTVMLAILAGVALAGILGALLAVPLVALAKRLVEAYYQPSRAYQNGP